MKKPIKKTIKRSEDCYVEFTDAELKELNIKAGDKFTWEMQDDGSCLLHKLQSIELDLSELSREVLEMIISQSLSEDLPVNDVICSIIERQLDQLKNE